MTAARFDPASLQFFLGGRDLEMVTIRELVEQVRPGTCHDRGLGWGARASVYREQILATLARRQTPVLVELEPDLDLACVRATEAEATRSIVGDGRTLILVDHHGAAAGSDRPTALHQVFQLLGCPPTAWTRRMELVAANDRGYLPALADAGATAEEMRAIRRDDRAAQGIAPEEEAAAEEAVRHREVRAGGALTVLRLPTDRMTAATDRMEPLLGGPGYRNLLCAGPAEVGFFGAGRWISELDRRFPGGWRGGALPVRGFWGHPIPPGPAEVTAAIEEAMAQDPPSAVTGA